VHARTVWPDDNDVMVRTLDLRLKGSWFDCRPFRFHGTTLDKLFTHMYFCHQAAYKFVPVEGRRTGHASQIQWFIHLRAQWLTEGR